MTTIVIKQGSYTKEQYQKMMDIAKAGRYPASVISGDQFKHNIIMNEFKRTIGCPETNLSSDSISRYVELQSAVGREIDAYETVGRFLLIEEYLEIYQGTINYDGGHVDKSALRVTLQAEFGTNTVIMGPNTFYDLLIRASEITFTRVCNNLKRIFIAIVEAKSDVTYNIPIFWRIINTSNIGVVAQNLVSEESYTFKFGPYNRNQKTDSSIIYGFPDLALYGMMTLLYGDNASKREFVSFRKCNNQLPFGDSTSPIVEAVVKYTSECKHKFYANNTSNMDNKIHEISYEIIKEFNTFKILARLKKNAKLNPGITKDWIIVTLNEFLKRTTNRCEIDNATLYTDVAVICHCMHPGLFNEFDKYVQKHFPLTGEGMELTKFTDLIEIDYVKNAGKSFITEGGYLFDIFAHNKVPEFPNPGDDACIAINAMMGELPSTKKKHAHPIPSKNSDADDCHKEFKKPTINPNATPVLDEEVEKFKLYLNLVETINSLPNVNSLRDNVLNYFAWNGGFELKDWKLVFAKMAYADLKKYANYIPVIKAKLDAKQDN